MTASLIPTPVMQFLDADGNPLVGGKVYTYEAGTSTPLETYTDYGGATPNANPVILNSRGEASIWFGSASYKIILKTSADVLIWTADNITAVTPIIYGTGVTAALAINIGTAGSVLIRNSSIAGSTGTLSSTLGVTGATTLLSTLAVTGATTLSSTLSVTGATTLSSTLAVTGITTVANGSLAAPSLVFAGDADSGFYKGTGASILAGLNGTEVLNINASTFDVKGALAANFPANVSIVGALSKGSGSFRIAHPHPALNKTHDLVHSFIEGPQADLIYRGQVALVDGKATVNIDAAATMFEGTFVLLCRNIQCFTSNETDWNPVRGSVKENILTIECQDAASVATISWMVIGERQDKHMLDATWTDDDGRVIAEPLKLTVVEENLFAA